MATISLELFKTFKGADKDKAFEALLESYSNILIEKQRYENIILKHFETTTPVGNIQATASSTQVQNKSTPRKFEPKILDANTRNLIIGSSIIKRIPLADLPSDISIHSYPGSTTEEKLLLTEEYEPRHLESLTIQDGTNSILKKASISVEEIFSQYKELVSNAHGKFTPKQLLLMEVIPTNFKLNNDKHIVRIQEFNALLHEWLEDIQSQMGSATTVTIIKT